MRGKISIIDYGAGNLRSVENTLSEIGAEYQVIQTPEEVRDRVMEAADYILNEEMELFRSTSRLPLSNLPAVPYARFTSAEIVEAIETGVKLPPAPPPPIPPAPSLFSRFADRLRLRLRPLRYSS